MNTTQLGQLAESKILADLQDQGYSVLVPWGDNERYDLVVENGGKFYRLQVKTGRLREGTVIFPCYNTPKQGTAEKQFYRGQIEYFAVYCPSLDSCYYIQIEEAPKTQMRLRVDTPNKKDSKINWAKNYVGLVLSANTPHFQ